MPHTPCEYNRQHTNKRTWSACLPRYDQGSLIAPTTRTPCAPALRLSSNSCSLCTNDLQTRFHADSMRSPFGVLLVRMRILSRPITLHLFTKSGVSVATRSFPTVYPRMIPYCGTASDRCLHLPRIPAHVTLHAGALQQPVLLLLLCASAATGRPAGWLACRSFTRGAPASRRQSLQPRRQKRARSTFLCARRLVCVMRCGSPRNAHALNGLRIWSPRGSQDDADSQDDAHDDVTACSTKERARCVARGQRRLL